MISLLALSVTVMVLEMRCQHNTGIQSEGHPDVIPQGGDNEIGTGGKRLPLEGCPVGICYNSTLFF